MKAIMGVGKECWVTTALDTTQCVKSLVLAKSLRAVMTSRPLVVLVSHLVSEELSDILQEEFDVCIRLDRKWAKIPGMTVELYAKIFSWTLVKWNKIVFLDPNCLILKNCDEIFENKGFSLLANDNGKLDSDVFVAKPSLDIWRKMMEAVQSKKIGNESKLFNEIFAKNGPKLLDGKFNVSIDLEHGLLAKDLDEILIAKFGGAHPMEILCKEESDLIFGTLEKAIMELWRSHFVQGVAQRLAKLENIHFNGLKGYLEQYRDAKMDSPIPLEDYKDAIAIVGISCRFPGANSLDEFWKLLIEGRDAIRHAPEGRWTTEKCPEIPEESKNSQGGFLSCSVDEFDGKFFGVSPMELSFMDPQQRLTLQVAWEAIEDAGINPLSLKDSYTGVYGGAWRTDYKESLQTAGVGETEFFRSYLGNSLGVITARISHCLGLTGPSIGTESGCSSSIVAVDLACKSLLRGETNLSLACGVNLLLHPFTGKTMNTVLAPDGHCKTFDANADGFGRAEGCGVLVLKRYSDAVRDGDRIWSLIRGTAVVQEGRSRSLGTPTKYCEALAMRMALSQAGVEPKDVSYVETHGTGTPVGDPLEVAAVAEVYSEGRSAENALTIGSVKTNIGHTESCSGIAGIIKVVLSLQNELIPPHKNFTTLNPAINLDGIPAKIPLEALAWKRDPTGKPRIAGVSSFGITGTDAHAIIQEAPAVNHPRLSFKNSVASRSTHILTLSAKTDEGLEDNLKLYKSFLEKTQEDLKDIAYTANVGRGHFPCRAAIVGSTNSEILEKIKSKSVTKKQAPDEPPKICFLFTGQGSQYPGMAKALYEQSPIFKMNFELCDRILNKNYGISIREALWGTNSKNLSRTIYSQTSIFCIEYCLLKLWESWGVKPDYVLGHSLGEFAAAVGAGILTFEGALKLVAERSRLIDELPGGKMLVLKESFENTDMLMKKAFEKSNRWLDYAAINSPEQTVVAGSEENVMAFAEVCKNNKIKCIVLEATHAFHSRHMDPILEKYRKTAETVEYLQPTAVFVSGMEGRIVEEPNHVNADYWVRHTRDSVRFAEASKAIMQRGCGIFLEAGPQPVLSALTMINSDGVPDIEPITCLPSIRKNEEDWPTILNTLGKLYVNGVDIDWQRFDQFMDNKKKVTIPFYPFQNKTHWFEIPDRGPGIIHPLVGTPVSNASAFKLYQNQLELNNVEFLKDHAIGNKVIYPGAGFLEMCLVSGHAATQCTETGYFAPNAPITLENFTIESPLGLSENDPTQMQAIVSSEDSGETRVTIYSKLVLDKETQKWIRHATAVFSPYAVQTKAEEELRTDTLESIRSRCLEQVVMTETYEKLAEFGLKFGPTFQTLKGMWKGDKEVCFEVKVTDSPDKFVCHPVVSDAMFQAVMIATNPEALKLHVPVSVNKFLWFAKIETETCFIHCTVGASEVTAVLYDSNAQLLAIMVGASMMETTVSTIMGALEAQKMSLPSMYEDVWRTQVGPMEKRADPLQCFNEVVFGQEFITDMREKFNPMSEEDLSFHKRSNDLYALYMINGLYDLGWVPKIGSTATIKELANSLKVVANLEGFLRYMMMELVVDGYFEIINPENRDKLGFRLIKLTPSQDKVIKEIDSLYEELHNQFAIETEYVGLTGKRLAVLLQGKESALPLLFPEDAGTNAASAEYYYKEARMCKSAHNWGFPFFEEFFKNCAKHCEETKTNIRILEVGAGTGSFTKPLLTYLNRYPAGYEFTYTDISPVFFQKGQQLFEDSKIKVHYRLLNIEDDPVAQGYIPHHYDMVIANNVVHATKSISQTISNLRNVLKDSGILLVSESVKPSRPTNLTFGLLDGYWRFEDFDLRPYNCEISCEQWEGVMLRTGFNQVASYPVFGDHFGTVIARATSTSKYLPSPTTIANRSNKAWVVFSEGGEVTKYCHKNLLDLGNQVVLVTRSTEFKQHDKLTYSVRPEEDGDITSLFHSVMKESNLTLEGVIYLWGYNYNEPDYTIACKPFLSLCKILLPLPKPKLFVITKGLLSIGDQEVTPPQASPLWAMTKCFQNEQPSSVCRCIDLDDTVHPTPDQLKEAFSEIFVDDAEIYVGYRGNQRNVSRYLPLKVPNTALSFPKSERFHLVLPSSNAINDLRFGAIEKIPVGENSVEVKVKAYALNFRDVFAVLKPSAWFEKLNTVGIDYAGIVTAVGSNVQGLKIGDDVFSTNLDGDALPSHIVTTETLSVKIPKHMTYCEAATMPAVAATAYLCLVTVAQLKKGDVILIHTGSGGVGLCAIQIAKSVGAVVVTTAGSKRKRAYLRNLGIKYIFHSRNTNYEKDIRTALNGRGVDIVLNSLTSPGFKEASLAVLNEGGRFIEMSKLNTWTPEEVTALRPDVQYDIVDLSASTPEEMSEIMKNISGIMEQDVIRPIPYVRFDAAEIRDALTYLQKAKHIGKIVCVMPEPEVEGRSSGAMVTHMFNDKSTYLITGGLGGIGLEVAKWMVQSGAKNIVLVGRNPPNEKAMDEIRRMNTTGKNVISMQFDVGNLEQCQQLLKTIESEEMNLPPLRGVMHAAGVLSDAIFSNQSWEKYCKTFNPKVNGGWNLHQMTLKYPLEHFVMFSSAVASFGSLGQSNHASANFFLDSLAFYRNSIGLPATTINWGQWGQVGVAANIEIIGLRPFSALQGISALERVMKSQRLQACVADADFAIVKEVFPCSKKYLDELKFNHTEQVKDLVISNEQFWNDYDAATDEDDRLEVVKRFVRMMIRQILKLDKDEALNDDENFQDLGMDSLMMIEMKNVVQSTLGKRLTITVNSVKDCHSVNLLAARLAQLLSGEETEVPPPTREELIKLIREDSELPEHIKPAEGAYCLPSQVKSIFITGATGNLGPYLLRDISNRSHIEKIYCLVREDKLLTGTQRLEKALAAKNILDETRMDKIECITGSVTQAKLGMSDKMYEDLSESVDAVVHLVVKSNFTDCYKKIERGDADIRTVNVKGTLNVLDFVCSIKTKVLLHASTIVANARLDSDMTLAERWPDADEFDEMPNTAYPISKFICDRLMAQAVERGLPVKVFRFPAVGGDSKTGGNVSYENNQLMLRMMSYLHLGVMPALPIPFFILPVDVCSDLSLRVFFDDATAFDLYNVYNPYAHNETELVLIGDDLGYRINIVEPEEFQAKLNEHEDSKLFHFLKEASDNIDAQNRFLKDTPVILQAWARNPERAFVSKKLSKIIPEYPKQIENTLAVIKRDLSCAKASGIFAKFGI